MAIASKNMEVGQEIPSVRKEVTLWQSRLFSLWTNPNIHTSWEVAKKGGLPAPIAQGFMSHSYISEMMTNFFGETWLKGGKLSISFINYTVPGDIITAKGFIREKTKEGSAVRFNCEVWCENQAGQKTVVGTASALVY
ncbi:MAG TPA: MaoC family dehydratase [Dehalococcoidia bacterium]|nr:MaoC family dehydratase [Dehalococcoidia bacterium]